ncbi:MAG: UDP-N-acetylmuramate dehydrogenase [Clostridia bacterium]|nr:UDP-N-acetylmuramate dehydrogenase [Clostridia bacterium]
MKAIHALKARLEQENIVAREQVVIAPYTTFHIGGAVALLVEPTTQEQLERALLLARQSGKKTFLLGRGSNVLFPDEPMDIVVIRTAAVRDMQREQSTITACCGATLAEIARLAQRASLCGMEFAHGIPGTLGGALCMNAGAYGGQMSDIVTSVRVYDTERDAIETLDCTQMNFSYRHSLLLSTPHLIALGATLALGRDNPAAIEARMQEYMRRRRESQPLEYPSAGSVFKRPEGHFAGTLIEQSGLKGCRIGGAMVSPKHAGFIVNVGGATARDVLLLIEHIKQTVERDHGVSLETEIQILTAIHAR